jgi:hypothetical protein
MVEKRGPSRPRALPRYSGSSYSSLISSPSGPAATRSPHLSMPHVPGYPTPAIPTLTTARIACRAERRMCSGYAADYFRECGTKLYASSCVCQCEFAGWPEITCISRPKYISREAIARRPRAEEANGTETFPALEDALILPVIPESRSDIRDPVPLCINVLHEGHWVASPSAVKNRGNDESRGQSEHP